MSDGSIDVEAARAALPEHWKRAFKWVEERMGGRIQRFESQGRWRPAWFFELECDGEQRGAYWRGARGEFHHSTGPLLREGKVLDVLEANGIPVPHSYGVCEDPPGLLLARLPGTFNLATERDEKLRAQTLEHYLELLARTHAIDPKDFEAIGMRRPKDGVESCFGELPSFERTYRKMKNRPDPVIEFQVGWVKRNVPRDRERVSFVCCDSGQFMFDKGRVTGLIDFELAYLGDPAADLAGLRSRQLSEPLGDLRYAMKRYGELAGEEVDTRAVDYHTIRFALTNPLSLAPVIAKPVPDMNYIQYLIWYVVYSRCPLEVMAHSLGVELEAPQLPGERPSVSHTASQHLVDVLGRQLDAAGEDRDESYEVDRLYRVAQYLERSDAFRSDLESDDLAEVAELLGHRPATWQAADAALEDFVLHQNAEGERDEELLRYCYRRLCREESLLEPTLRELEGARMDPID